ncbi:phage tail assembly protein [Pseudomonas sp. CCI3.1]|uniref:phage tail assembly protein n=1 Tax=Pseudomonas sp. CCI3.1 TaxID=3048618 RepID=UPI002AB367F9|nr:MULTISPECIES: phage tail assembly protein [unclassified Pseudomonas]MDY7584352.1 phage tail assembly protein [Pseudomonas sp. CCI3.1]MEB0065556.1 phage tail assembly protein [Pseudomonas sp. CCI3.1]MEB0071164.1 phage tail assembly protein [Pseudomonas sp. CCI1.4]
MTTNTEKKIPTWLTLTDEGVTVSLRYPAELNSIKTDKITLRAPTVRDVRTAQATSGNDAEQREMQLFASLAEVSVKDLECLKLLDYQRVQEGYFRLVNEDEL